MPSHETPALHYWRNLNSTLDAIGARPVLFPVAYRCWETEMDLDEAGEWLAEGQRDEAHNAREAEREMSNRGHDFSGELSWGPWGNAPSKAESWGR